MDIIRRLLRSDSVFAMAIIIPTLVGAAVICLIEYNIALFIAN